MDRKFDDSRVYKLELENFESYSLSQQEKIITSLLGQYELLQIMHEKLTETSLEEYVVYLTKTIAEIKKDLEKFFEIVTTKHRP